MKGQQWLGIRRWLDAGVCIVALPVVVPIGALAAAAVWAYDRHPPLVHLDRAGRNGDTFAMIKLRSMRPARADDASVTAAADDRITPVGHRLRRLRIDEIPQVFQVLAGSMALIGPRPEDPSFVDATNDDWNAVLRARPAIAGLTQIIASPWEAANLAGADAESLYTTVAVPAKLAIDRWYVENASPAVDRIVVTSLAHHLLGGAEWTAAHDLVAAEVPAAEVLLRDHRPS